jgi:hypothetical protein
LLSGCDGSKAPIGAVPSANVFPGAVRHSQTFHYTGARQAFIVPDGVRKIAVVAVGARGAGPTEARGGRVWAVIPVKPAERLWVYVGGAGSELSGGFNGGADGGQGFTGACGCDGYGGGGASDIRRARDELRDRVIVVGGGGGDGGSFLGLHDVGGVGGDGGSSIGGAGACGNRGTYQGCSGPCIGGGGYGGTQHQGGSGGFGSLCYVGSGGPGANGTFSAGGAGGTGRASSGYPYYQGLGGGGGGGGYYGGGGGGAGSSYSSGQDAGGGGGGGGGSSFIEPSAIAYHSWQGWRINTPDGLVVFDW